MGAKSVATNSKKLTRTHKRWAEMVNAGMNGTKAVREIWPHYKRPQDYAYKLRQLPQVREYMARLDAQCMETAQVSRTEIVLGLARTGRFDPRKLEHEDGRPKKLSELDDDTAAALNGMELEETTNSEGKVTGRIRKYRAGNKNEAWRELASIAGLKREEGAPPVIGPGLTVIIQQANVVQGGTGSVSQANRVEVSLPPPSRPGT